jgi:hypothetical protein
MTRVILENQPPPTGGIAEAPSREPSSGYGTALGSSARRSRVLFNVVAVVVTIVFSYIALTNINLKLAGRALRTSDYWWIAAALVAFGLGAVTRAMRWRSLFARGRRPPFGVMMNATMVGYLYNSIMPARAGEAARVVVLSRRSSAGPVEIVGTVVVERLYDVLAILVIFFAAEPWLPHVSWFGAAAVAAISLAGLIAGAAIVLAIYGDRPIRFLLRPLKWVPWFSSDRLDHAVRELAHGFSGLRNWAQALEAFGWTIVAWLFTSLCAYLVTLAFHLHVSFACGILVAVAVGLSMILPSPPAAVGVFEAAALIALNAYGVSNSSALPYALLLHLVNFVPYVLVGALLLQYNARHPRSATPGEAAGIQAA